MRILRNEEILNLSYVPDNLLFREEQIETLRNVIVDPLRHGITGTAVIFGEPGTGKTAISKYLQRSCMDLDYVYRNALSFPSLTSLMRDVLASFMRFDPASAFTLSDLMRMLASVEQKRGKSLLLVIDESTNLLRHDQTGVYNIMRASEIYPMKLSAILVSLDNPEIIFRKQHVRSLSNYVPVKLRLYTRAELRQIVQDRAAKALASNSFSDDIVDLIADIASQLGSARVAVELIQKAALVAEGNSNGAISAEDVRSAKALINPYFTESKLGELSEEELAVLLAVCYLLKKTPIASVSDAYVESGVVCESYGFASIEKQRFYSIIRRLEDSGLLDSKKEGRGDRGGVEKMIMINDVPIEPLSQRIEGMLDHRRHQIRDADVPY